MARMAAAFFASGSYCSGGGTGEPINYRPRADRAYPRAPRPARISLGRQGAKVHLRIERRQSDGREFLDELVDADLAGPWPVATAARVSGRADGFSRCTWEALY